MDGKTFDFPKSLHLISDILKLTLDKNGVVLDFFSGSATTAHAVMKLNAEDGGKRKFIMVQLPEKTDEKSEAYKAGYKNICEIGKERIRRAGEQIKQELIEKKEKAGMLDENIVDPESLDIGFKVFKLDETNIKAWDSSADVTKETLLDQVEVIKTDRSKEDVLYEILLKYGVFNHAVKEITINGQTMYDIADGYMIVNLNDSIEDKDIKEIAKAKPHVVIFLESGFSNDNDKINAEATLKHNGVEDVKCI
jgi:adenine-specific DNA-methyltransferase